MGMKSLKWERTGTKNLFLLISTFDEGLSTASEIRTRLVKKAQKLSSPYVTGGLIRQIIIFLTWLVHEILYLHKCKTCQV